MISCNEQPWVGIPFVVNLSEHYNNKRNTSKSIPKNLKRREKLEKKPLKLKRKKQRKQRKQKKKDNRNLLKRENACKIKLENGLKQPPKPKLKLRPIMQRTRDGEEGKNLKRRNQLMMTMMIWK